MTKESQAIALREATFRLTLQGGTPTLSTASNGVQALLGYSAEDFLSGKVALPQLIHADDQDIAETLFSPARQSNEGDCNLRVRPASGRILCVKGLYRRETTAAGVVLDLLLQDAKSLPRTMAGANTSPMFAAIMENTDDYIYFKDRHHVFTGASQTLVALCSPAEHWTDLIGQTDYDVFPEKFADIYYRLEKQVFAGIAVAHEVQETLGKDGQKGWVDNRKYPIRDASGAIIGLYGIARDITALKQAEVELQTNEYRWKFAVEGGGDGLWDWNIPASTVFFTKRWKEMLGFTEDEIGTGLEEWSKRVHPEDLPRVMADVQAHLAGTTAHYANEHRVSCKDGSWKWILDRGLVVSRDAAGQPLRMIGTHSDITARKQAEVELHQSRQAALNLVADAVAGRDRAEKTRIHLEREVAARQQADALLQTEKDRVKTILETAEDPLFVKDDEHRIITANRAFCNMFAVDLDAVMGQTLAENVPADERQHFLAVDRQVLDTGIPNECEESLTVGGVTKTVVTKKSRFTEPSGKKFLVGSIHDITLRKQAELYGTMAREILHKLNEPGELAPAIQRTIGLLKTGTGVDAVGIRLQAGDDFPYFAQEGFAPDFLLTENTLVAQAGDGGVCRNPDGSACLECTCGLVISGRTDPANKLFTPGGSCWMNDSFPLLKIPAREDPRLHPRNECIHRGYASVALIPIRTGTKIVGLIQLNDRRKGCFSLLTVELLEGIAAHLGTALLRRQAEEILKKDHAAADRMRRALLSTLEDQKRAQTAVREREVRYGAMVDSISDAIISADSAGKIVGWNPGAEKIFGYPESEILGQSLTLLLPARHHDRHHAGMARVVAGGPHHIIGTTVEVEGRRKDGTEFPLNLSLSEWSIGTQKYFTAIIHDITVRKAAAATLAAKLDELRRWQGATLGREGRVLELKREINALRASRGEPPKYASVLPEGKK